MAWRLGQTEVRGQFSLSICQHFGGTRGREAAQAGCPRGLFRILSGCSQVIMVMQYTGENSYFWYNLNIFKCEFCFCFFFQIMEIKHVEEMQSKCSIFSP